NGRTTAPTIRPRFGKKRGLSLSKKAGCAVLFRQDTFPLRLGRGRGNAQGSAYRQIENTSAGMQEGAASPFLCHPQRRRVRREERLQAASAIMFRPCASRTGT